MAASAEQRHPFAGMPVFVELSDLGWLEWFMNGWGVEQLPFYFTALLHA